MFTPDSNRSEHSKYKRVLSTIVEARREEAYATAGHIPVSMNASSLNAVTLGMVIQSEYDTTIRYDANDDNTWK